MSRSTAQGKLFAFLRGSGRPAVWVGLAAAAIAGACWAVWSEVRQYALSSDEYLVGPQQVHITPPPEWIRTDICSEVFHNTSLDGPLSILDEDLTERISNAFSLHPWVAQVRRVSKHHPAQVEVELLYRQPVCMVQAPGGLFPVDAQGVLLPSGDFSRSEALRYPRLVGIDRVPTGTLGESWGDRRVAGGAEVADALKEVWDELKLSQIVPSATPGGHTYTLVTRGGTRIFWGRPPSTKAPNELPPDDKIVRLKQYTAEHGTLEGQGGPQNLDVRDLPAPRVSSRL